ncbi:MAG: diacylglycerol kinase family protein [Corynebacterium sp.]|uniref:diacylglycerol kinase family protein n=1 Tax=Corynebacterium sp. TaxID=1720 RepID=UPI0026DAB59D|nr:diacylglycerol kinase family protein [Corynebacterium sp.]MDO5097386.1 diacylglycerol kinase family protein [Corynebacterium sp.]
MKRIALLTNPAAGKGTATEAMHKARRRFQAHGIDVIGISGATRQSSAELCKRALEENIDALVVCGGDGMISLALQEQAGTHIPLGIIPAGTGNDHARAFGIPLDAEEAADVVATGTPSITDLGVMKQGERERVFGTVACTGFDSLVNDRAARLPWPRGSSRYLAATALEFVRFHAMDMIITFDDGSPQTFNATSLAVGNTSSYGGGMLICPSASPYDGVFDVTIIEEMGRIDAMRKFPKIFSGDIGSVDSVRTFQARKVRVDMPVPVAAYADGERFTLVPVECSVLEKQGCFIIPAV